MTDIPDTHRFAPPEAPLPMPVQSIEPPMGPPSSVLWRLLTPWLRRAAD